MDISDGGSGCIGGRFKRTGKRSEIFLATKFGLGRHWEGDEARVVNGTPEWASKALDRSLQQLGVDYIRKNLLL